MWHVAVIASTMLALSSPASAAAGSAADPRDYYLLYIHPQTHRLRGCEYIVTYRGVLPQGVEASPPNLLLYEEQRTVNGLVVPARYEIFRKQGHVPFASVRVSDWSFTQPFDASRLVMPAAGLLDRSMP